MVVVHQNMSVKVTVLPTESYNLTRTVLCGVSGRGKGLVAYFINFQQPVGPILHLPRNKGELARKHATKPSPRPDAPHMFPDAIPKA